MSLSHLSYATAAALLAVALGIAAVQRRAHACTVHSRAAGRMAVALAWLCVAGAVGLVVVAAAA